MDQGSWASSPGVRASMQSNRSRDTKPEIALRRKVHALGLRYYVARAPFAGMRRKADLIFPRAKIAIFLDGCFWHGCPHHFRRPITNAEYWDAKISGNRQRDSEVDTQLAAAGWLVIRVWEHEDMASAADSIAQAVRSRINLRPDTRPLPSPLPCVETDSEPSVSQPQHGAV
jgi:DNA mismatch endonuclease (patch repair protein)